MVAQVETIPHPFAAALAATDPVSQAVQPAPDQQVPPTASPEPAGVETLIDQSIADQMTPDQLAALRAELDALRPLKPQYETLKQEKAKADELVAQIERTAREAEYKRQLSADSRNIAEQISKLDNNSDIEQVISTYVDNIVNGITQTYQQMQTEQQMQVEAQKQQDAAAEWQENKPGFVDWTIKELSLDPRLAPELHRFDTPDDIAKAAKTFADWQKKTQTEAQQAAGQAQLAPQAASGAFAPTPATGQPIPTEFKPMAANSPEARAMTAAILNMRPGA